MIDQAHINLLQLLPGQFKKVGSTGGGEYHGPCPFCGGKDRFIVQPKGDNGGRWWCRQCGKSGDPLAFVMQYESLDFKAACERLKLDAPDRPLTPRPPQPELYASDLKDYACFEPEWQAAAAELAESCSDALQDNWPGRAGRYLEDRGISRQCALAAFLGVNNCGHTAHWGSAEVYLPRGITIPWEIGQQLWNIRVRRPNADLAGADLAKYASAKGCANGVYHISQVRPGDTVIMSEGEFDNLVLENYLRDRDSVKVVSIGSNTGGRVLRWVARLALAESVLLAFDNDAAGDAAADWWKAALPKKAGRLRPTRKDITEMWQAGELPLWIGDVV